MSVSKGVVAAGHEITATAAVDILEAGGNAFDASLAALFASCVAEPVLASLGGGGFLLSLPQNTQPMLYDFFVQTPQNNTTNKDVDFYPIMADFGTAKQEFHIGLGSIAVPGMVKGIFALHHDLCRMPLERIIEPALIAARNGVVINNFQHYISNIVSPIITSNPATLRLHEAIDSPGRIAQIDEVVRHPDLADTFELLVKEGENLFYQGDMANGLVRASLENGGYLRQSDLERYQVVRRYPLTLNHRKAKIYTNPAPSVGGTLIAFSLALLESANIVKYTPNGFEHLTLLGRAMMLTQKLRQDAAIDQDLQTQTSRSILTEKYLSAYREIMDQHPVNSRGTTQISVADADGNLASMTLSNGEGSGFVIPGTGIMMNNMLGEEDINPHGFHQWPENRRIASMMSPTVVLTHDGNAIVTGSGGSNRIRSAILQVLINLLEFEMEVEEAVEHPRIHFEGNLLNIESEAAQEVLTHLQTQFTEIQLWPQKNLFFGGAHTVVHHASGQLSGKGDSRRGGVCMIR